MLHQLPASVWVILDFWDDNKNYGTQIPTLCMLRAIVFYEDGQGRASLALNNLKLSVLPSFDI